MCRYAGSKRGGVVCGAESLFTLIVGCPGALVVVGDDETTVFLLGDAAVGLGAGGADG